MNEFAMMHDAMKAYCERYRKQGWPSPEMELAAERLRLSLWECANNDPPHPSALENLAREAEALAKART